jgi:hypothetical protein
MTYEPSRTPEAEDEPRVRSRRAHRPGLNKVPDVTVHFWIIKVLCTTVGDGGLGFGTVVASALLLAVTVGRWSIWS